jgi:Caspase domain
MRFAPLKLAARDAQALGAALEDAGRGVYADVRVEYAIDTEATPAALTARIDRMARSIHPRDTFIVFAAAHGTSERGRFYLIPQDFRSGPDALAQRAIGQDTLQDWVANRIKAKRALILLDTCESGALVAGGRRDQIDLLRPLACACARTGERRACSFSPILQRSEPSIPALAKKFPIGLRPSGIDPLRSECIELTTHSVAVSVAAAQRRPVKGLPLRGTSASKERSRHNRGPASPC